MTKRAILNVSSTKKKDNMVSYSNVTPANPGGTSTYTVAPATLIGGQTYIFPWIATARPGFSGDGSPPFPIQEASRTATLCYMRGLKERVQVQTSTGMPWQWRRVCFTMKGDDLYQAEAGNYRWSLLASNGVVRLVNNIAGTTVGSSVVDLVFDGKNGGDWLNVFNAKLDTQKISVKYDRTHIIQSGNASGVMRNYNHWYQMNKNLQFDDEENGSGEELGRYSVRSKVGMGDYYVMDFISAGSGSTSADQMTFLPEATLYWHEK
jgi:hypothetical protein